MKKKLVLPKFKNEKEEHKFWQKIDLSDYYDASDLVPVSFPNLKPTTRSISLRLPVTVISQVKTQANQMNVPYQSLMKQYIAQGATLPLPRLTLSTSRKK